MFVFRFSCTCPRYITMPAIVPEKSSMETALSETTTATAWRLRLLLQNKASAHARDALGRTASRHAKLAGYDLPQLEQCTVLWRMFQEFLWWAASCRNFGGNQVTQLSNTYCQQFLLFLGMCFFFQGPYPEMFSNTDSVYSHMPCQRQFDEWDNHPDVSQFFLSGEIGSRKRLDDLFEVCNSTNICGPLWFW